MVDKKISELEDAGAAASTDVVPIVRTSTTKKLTIGAILTLLLAGIIGGKVLIGGTGTTDKLIFQGTSGNGTLTAPSIQMNVGNNGATTAMTILNSGNVGIGTTGPGAKLEVGSQGLIRVTGGVASGYGWPTSGTGFETAYVSDYNNGFGVTGSGVFSVVNRSDATRKDLIFDAANFQYRANGLDTGAGMVITSGGNIGIGTKTPGTAGLAVMNGNVGIGTTGPQQKLEINGGMRLNTATAKPTCAASIRGTIWYVAGGAGVADTMEACTKDAGDAYAWRTLY